MCSVRKFARRARAAYAPGMTRVALIALLVACTANSNDFPTRPGGGGGVIIGGGGGIT